MAARVRPGRRAPSSVLVLAVVVGLVPTLVLAGCGSAGSGAPAAATLAQSPSAVLSDAVTVAAGQVQAALRGVGLTATVAPVPYRPAESPTLAAASRLVLKATLPDDESHGFIVLYDFPTPTLAYTAGTEMAAYLASGPGRVQFPPDAEQVIRQLGATLVFYSWSPANSPGEGAANVAKALATLGLEIPIVR